MWVTKIDHSLKKEEEEDDHNYDNDDEEDDDEEDYEEEEDGEDDDKEEEDYDEYDGWKLKVAMHWEGRLLIVLLKSWLWKWGRQP